jgi:RNA polymerase sigma-70 factor (ECF subfamily)
MSVLASSVSRPRASLVPGASVGVARERSRRSSLDPLIARAQAGEEAAFRELFIAHRETVARIVHRYMGPSSEVEDVVQDVFVHVYRSIGKFRGDSKFTTWLYRLTANVTKMHLRKKRSRPRTVDAPVPEKRPEDAPVETPDLAIARQRRVEALYRLVDRLSEKKREALVLHDFEGLSAKEIAERVDAPVLTVRTRLFYARKELYAALAEEPALAQVVEQLMPDLPGKPRTEAKKKANRSKRKRRNTG